MVSGKSLLTSKIVIYSTFLLLVASAMGDAHYGFSESLALPVAVSPQSLNAIKLEDGDLVFRAGRDVIARLILTQGDSTRYSHVGVIVRRDNDLFVVHTLPHDESYSGGVFMESLASFTSSENAKDVGFYRVKDLRSDSRLKIRDYVLQQIGKPFDDKFQYSSDNSFYCTELAMKALAAGDADLSKSTKSVTVMLLTESVVPPDNLRRSVKLEMLRSNLIFIRTHSDKVAEHQSI